MSARQARRLLVLAWAVMLTLAGIARAQFIPGVGDADETPGSGTTSGLFDSHGWAVLPHTVTGDAPPAWRVVHLPPRRLARLTDGKAHGAPDGTTRPLRFATLPREPIALAASGGRLALVFPPREEGGGRPVITVSARPSGVADLWRDEPSQGFLLEPELPPEGELIGFAADQRGLAALFREPSDDPDEPRYTLRTLHGARWTSEEIRPPPMLAEIVRVTLAGSPSGVMLVTLDAEGWAALGEAAPTAAASSDPDGRIVPAARRVRLFESPAEARRASNARLFTAGDDLFAASAERGRVVVVRAGEESPVTVWTFDAPADGVVSLIPSPGTGRAVLIAASPPTSGEGASGSEPAETGSVRRGWPIRVVERSLWTGQVFYDGPPVGPGLISPHDVRLLLAGLLGLAAVVLVFVLRTEGKGAEFSLPEGLAMAEPGRRLIASLIDTLLALIIALRFWGLSPGSIFEPDVWSSAVGVWVVMTLLGVGLGVGTLMEGLLGRTVGKMLTGCEVVRVEGDEAVTPGLWRALVRNVVKWTLPPVGMLAFLDPSGRHRGETLTGTGVVVRPEPDGEPE
ncbi:MAG: RDD family protein [Phycisphaeraceae bacterium]|nr:MAG: RDD family protein [Phycisphaeraceae bacterium]